MQTTKVNALILYLRRLQRLTNIVKILSVRKGVEARVNTIWMKQCITESTTSKTTMTCTTPFSLNTLVIRNITRVRMKKATAIKVRKKEKLTSKSNHKSNNKLKTQAKELSFNPNTYIWLKRKRRKRVKAKINEIHRLLFSNVNRTRSEIMLSGPSLIIRDSNREAKTESDSKARFW